MESEKEHVGGDAVTDFLTNGKYLRRKQAGAYSTAKYGFGAPRTLAKLAVKGGGGPRFRKAGRIVLYTREDIDEWAQSKISAPRTSTSESHMPARERRAIV